MNHQKVDIVVLLKGYIKIKVKCRTLTVTQRDCCCCLIINIENTNSDVLTSSPVSLICRLPQSLSAVKCHGMLEINKYHHLVVK